MKICFNFLYVNLRLKRYVLLVENGNCRKDYPLNKLISKKFDMFC